MTATKKPQWKKRVELTQFFYACLMKKLNKLELVQKEMQRFSFNQQQKKVIEYFGQNCITIKQQVEKLLKEGWTLARIPVVAQAILFTAYCENKTLGLTKAIAIDQALVSCNHYSQEQHKKFINAVLEKLLNK